jgi:hypothetical protein
MPKAFKFAYGGTELVTRPRMEDPSPYSSFNAASTLSSRTNGLIVSARKLKNSYNVRMWLHLCYCNKIPESGSFKRKNFLLKPTHSSGDSRACH